MQGKGLCLGRGWSQTGGQDLIIIHLVGQTGEFGLFHRSSRPGGATEEFQVGDGRLELWGGGTVAEFQPGCAFS